VDSDRLLRLLLSHKRQCSLQVAVTVFWVKSSWVCGQDPCSGGAGSTLLEEALVLISGPVVPSRQELLFQGDKD